MPDSVDGILEDWSVQRPDLDFSPVGVVTRLARVRAHLDAGLARVFDPFDLSPADFQVVVTLRRAGAPYRLPQATPVAQLGLTSGTVSVRVDRLARRGVVVQEPARPRRCPRDARATDRRGLPPVPHHRAGPPAQRGPPAVRVGQRRGAQLAELLRRLLSSFESPGIDLARPLGLRLEAAHLARERRVVAGLSDTPGLLVLEVAPAGPAADAGVRIGDLVVAVNGTPVRDTATLGAALSHRQDPVRLWLRRGNDAVELDVRRPR